LGSPFHDVTTSQNELHLEPLADGRWRLFGYFRGERSRKANRDFAVLDAKRLEMEAQLATAARGDCEATKAAYDVADRGSTAGRRGRRPFFRPADALLKAWLPLPASFRLSPGCDPGAPKKRT